MAKKINLKFSLVTIISAALAVLAVLAFLLPYVNLSSEIIGTKTTAAYSGFALAFGSEKVPIQTIIGNLTTNAETDTKLVAIVLVAFILIVLGILVQLASFCPSKIIVKNIKIINLAAAALMIAGGVLCFFTLGSFGTANEITSEGLQYYKLGIGAILCGIFAIISGLGKICEIVKK